MIFIKHKLKLSVFIAFVFCMFPIISYATAIDTDVEGYTQILNMLKLYVRGSGAVALMIGSADFFISLSYEGVDRLVKAMHVMGAGCFLMLADNFVQFIGTADGSTTFVLLFSMVGLIILFIGVVLTALGSYNVLNSFKERNPETRNRSIKILFSGLMLIAISQSLSTFI